MTHNGKCAENPLRMGKTTFLAISSFLARICDNKTVMEESGFALITLCITVKTL